MNRQPEMRGGQQQREGGGSDGTTIPARTIRRRVPTVFFISVLFLLSMISSLIFNSALVVARSVSSSVVTVGLPHRNLTALDRLFWQVSDPLMPEEYLRFRSIGELRKLIGYEENEEIIQELKRWLSKNNVTQVRLNALGDALVGSLPLPSSSSSSSLSSASSFSQDDSPNDTHKKRREAQKLLSGFTPPPWEVDFILMTHERDEDDNKLLHRFRNRRHRQSRSASASSFSSSSSSSFSSSIISDDRNDFYSVSQIKEAYGIPENFTAQNASTLQMVWGPGTFGYSPSTLAEFAQEQCPLMGLDRVEFDTENHGEEGGDNFMEGENESLAS